MAALFSKHGFYLWSRRPRKNTASNMRPENDFSADQYRDTLFYAIQIEKQEI